MHRTDRGSYTLAYWLQFVLVLFFFMLGAVVVMVAIIIGGAVEIKGTVENAMANPSKMSEFASKVIPTSLIRDAISGALPPSAIRQALLDALDDPEFQRVLQGLLAAALFGSSQNSETTTKRDDTTCRGISDTGLCSNMLNVCAKLNECGRRRNVTMCQMFARDAVLICNSL